MALHLPRAARAAASKVGRLRGRRGRRLTLLCAAVAVGVLVLAGQAAPTHAQTNPPNGITVIGQGTASLPPDMATISGSVETQAAAATDALNQNSQTVQAVIDALQAAGVDPSNIHTTNISVYPVFSQPQTPTNGGPAPAPTITGFNASEGISVKTTDLTTVGALIQTMVTAGVNNFNGVNYGLQNPEQLRAMALQAAIADAQNQAQTAAGAANVTLGAIVNLAVQSSSAPPVPAPAFRVAAASTAAPPPTIPGPIMATTNVSVTFAILSGS